MRRVRLSLALGALFSLGLATNAHAVSTESTWSATATGSAAGGSKSAPAPFVGSWNLGATNNINPTYRPANPASWSWSWEGVTVRQKGFASCTVEAINDAKSVSVCPPGSLIGVGPVPKAQFGPIGLAEGPNTDCFGKTFGLYNGPSGQLTLVIDGPPAECGSLGFLGAFPINLATSGGKTTMTWPVPENLRNPFPGAESTLNGGQMVFPKKTTKIKSGKASAAKKASLFTSINCKGTREFTYTVVDTFGTQVIKTSAGKCKPPKGKKKR